MKKLLITSALSALLTLPALADYYVAGEMNGWDPAGTLMTDMGGGIYQAAFTGLTPGRYEFKVTQGDWTWSTPIPGNSWLYTDGSGNVTLTYDINTYADGWSSSSGRLGVNVDPGTWTAVGDWQAVVWNNADPTTAMSALGGGIYEYEAMIATPGTYAYKAVDTGSWDAIGADARGVNADNLSFTTTSANQLVDFYVNALDGTIRLELVPEPGSAALLGLGGLVLLVFRRRS